MSRLLYFMSSSLEPAPLSLLSLCTVGDYDGEVTQIDLESGHMVAEADGHAGRRCAALPACPLHLHSAWPVAAVGALRLSGGKLDRLVSTRNSRLHWSAPWPSRACMLMRSNSQVTPAHW